MGITIVTSTPGIGTTKRSRLEIKTKKYYLDGVTKDEIKELEDTLLLPEQTIIREAYYGKAQFEPHQIGLNIIMDYKDNFVDGIRLATLTVVYTKKNGLDELMNGLNADKVEDLAGKPILAYRIKSEELGKKLIAISAYLKNKL